MRGGGGKTNNMATGVWENADTHKHTLTRSYGIREKYLHDLYLIVNGKFTLQIIEHVINSFRYMIWLPCCIKTDHKQMYLLHAQVHTQYIHNYKVYCTDSFYRCCCCVFTGFSPDLFIQRECTPHRRITFFHRPTEEREVENADKWVFYSLPICDFPVGLL